jgi:hypothetical protein
MQVKPTFYPRQRHDICNDACQMAAWVRDSDVSHSPFPAQPIDCNGGSHSAIWSFSWRIWKVSGLICTSGAVKGKMKARENKKGRGEKPLIKTIRLKVPQWH